MLYGRTSASMPSRFLREIPDNVVVKKGGYETVHSSSGYYRASTYTAITSTRPANYGLSTEQTTKVKYLELNKGDMVQHTAFGRGMVISVLKMGDDALLEIAFDQIGTKRLMAKTASAHMKRL